jgi:uncharacterized metal-binding protein
MKCEVCSDRQCREGVDCFDGAADPIPHLSDEDARIWRAASQVEAEHYCKLPRIDELVEFSKLMGYRKLGLAFCIGLQDESELVVSRLSTDFDVVSVCCKACGVSKDDLGLLKIHGDGFEAACNPVGQALLLAEEDTDLNVILGLCLGHDVLFARHSKAPVTTLAVKDRVLAHNPLGAIYSKYYRKTWPKGSATGR